MKCLTDYEIALYFDGIIKEEKKKKIIEDKIRTCPCCFERYIGLKKFYIREKILFGNNHDEFEKQEKQDDIKKIDFNVMVKLRKKDLLFNKNSEDIFITRKDLQTRNSDKTKMSLLFNKKGKEFYLYFLDTATYILSMQFLKLLTILIDDKIHFHSPCQKNQEIQLPQGKRYDLSYEDEKIVFELKSFN